jgi:phospho-N-acetylmuramoyl-pentapeptide-transferase
MSFLPTINFVHAKEITSLTRIGVLAVASLVISMFLTPIYTHLAFKHEWWKHVRENAVTGEKAPIFHKLHAAKHKRHIPTMAGMVIVLAVSLVTIIFNLERSQTWLLVFALVVFGGLGLVDDISNVLLFADKSGGIKVRTQLISLIVLAGAGAWWFYYKLGYHSIHVPAVGDFSIGWLYIPLFILVVVSSAKSVSITDGLDGLAGGLLSAAFGVYTVIAYFQGNYGIAGFCAAVVGAMLTYTWFNIYPARFFMGQTGSVAIGATLGVVAMLTNTVFVLPIIAGVFVVEAGSSLIQIMSKKIFKRKIFLSAPLHHHLEAIGWPVCGAVGLILALVGNKLG